MARVEAEEAAPALLVVAEGGLSKVGDGVGEQVGRDVADDEGPFEVGEARVEVGRQRLELRLEVSAPLLVRGRRVLENVIERQQPVLPSVARARRQLQALAVRRQRLLQTHAEYTSTKIILCPLAVRQLDHGSDPFLSQDVGMQIFSYPPGKIMVLA